MRASCRSWWRNCALATDDEMAAIDRLEDEITPLDSIATHIRELIGSFELCHHKADRWVENIIEAIAGGDSRKGLGSRQPGNIHEAEEVWQEVCDLLLAWIERKDERFDDFEYIGSVSKAQLLSGLGEWSKLKVWQVQRVIQKVRSLIHFPRDYDEPETRYEFLLLKVGDYEAEYLEECPKCYKGVEDFWLTTVRIRIYDTNNGEPSELSLALAIDMLWPCHWDFLGNLQIVIDAIGGNLHPQKPFAACGRNITLIDGQGHFKKICVSLKDFCEHKMATEGYPEILQTLGRLTLEKHWLAASLAKTLELQLDPPADIREVSALTSP